MFRHSLAMALCAAVTTGVWATTYVVDGPGDGDAMNGDEYDSITAVLTDNAISPEFIDGSPDVINIVVDALTAPTGVIINGTTATVSGHFSFTDDLTINGDADGNSTECLINITASTGVNIAGVAIDVAVSQEITIRDLVIIPTHTGANLAIVPVVVDEADGGVGLVNATVNLENLLITASSAGNAPMDPTTAAPVSGSHFSGGNGSGIGLFSNPAGSNSTSNFNISDCVIAHGRTDNISIFCDGPTVNITDTRSTRSIFGGLGDGITISGANGTTTNMTRVVSDFNDEHGINGAGTTAVNINEGCSFSNNGFRGMTWATGGTITVTGTSASPVTVASNGNRGFVTSNTLVVVPSVSNMIVRNNGAFGIEFNEIGLQAASPVFSNVLIANNGSITATPSNFRIGDTNATSATIEFNDCTIHNTVAATSADADLLIPALFQVDAAGTTNLDLVFNGCILSGNGNEAAFDLTNGSGKRALLNDSALVVAGATPVSVERSDSDGTVVQSNVTFDTPDYAGTALPPVVGTDFAVRNPNYATAGVAGGALGGWGGYIGGGIPVELSIFTTE